MSYEGAAAHGIGKVAVVGAGTMGPGIAVTFARHGHTVALCDNRPAALERAASVMRGALSTLADNGEMARERIDAILDLVRPTTDLAEAGAEADLLIEAISENKEAKRALFAALHAVCPPRTIFASNTSYLNIFECTSRPERTVVAHWFAPPHLLPLVEVVRGPKTDAEVVERVAAVLRAAGKVAVVLPKFVPGFAVNRLQRAIGREVFFLLENGYISPEGLDLAVKASIAPRMMLLGVVQRYDFAGLDLTAGNLANEEYEDAPPARAPQPLLDLVRAGHFGVKSGRGFHDYEGHTVEEVLRARDDGLLAILRGAYPYMTPSMPLDEGVAGEARGPNGGDVNG